MFTLRSRLDRTLPVTIAVIDYGWEDRKEVGELRDDIGAIRLGLDSRFQKTPIITRKNRAAQPGNAFEDTELKPGFEIARF